MKWFRSETDKKFAGVCGGVAEVLDIDSSVVRIIAFTLLFTPVPIVITYFAAWFILPRKGEVNARNNSGNTNTTGTNRTKSKKEFLTE
jgi:phage shock protein C